MPDPTINWKRFLVTLESFYKQFGKWPTKIHLYPFFIRELEDRLPEGDFKKLNTRLLIIRDHQNELLTLDDEGNSLDYHGSKKIRYPTSEFKALAWLGIQEPDYSFKIEMPVTFTKI